LGRYWGGGGCLGAVIIGCVVYGIQLGWGCVVSGLVCLTSSGFSSVLFFSVGVIFQKMESSAETCSYNTNILINKCCQVYRDVSIFVS